MVLKYLQKVVINKCKHVITKSRTIDYWSTLQMPRARARTNTTTVLTRTVDTDVIIILVGKFFNLLSLNPN